MTHTESGRVVAASITAKEEGIMYGCDDGYVKRYKGHLYEACIF
ncbi:MAG: hypothetical protein ACXU9J_06505 [Syntrophales bacterium]